TILQILRGFILFCRSSNIYIWNPSTGVHKQIPLSPFGGSNLDVDYFYGFGVYTKSYRNDTVEIWVMEEYEVNSSWTMTLALPIDDIPIENFSLLCCTKSGDIIGTDDGDDGSGLVIL
ncbi:hypothetical protein RYX36_017622, partial [Vicia faba]